jgi:hypothetical protein
MRSELAVLRTLRDSNRWPDAILRLEAFLETHNEVFNRYPLDHAEILLEAAVTYAGNGHVEGVHSARQRVISLLSEVALVEKAACRAERGLGIQAQGRAGIPSVLYPWCERSSSRISNLISKAVIFSVDNAQPGSVRELARRAFELYSKDPDSAARARAIQDHALVEAAIAIRSQQSILPPLTLTPLCAAQLSALADVVKGTIGDISLLPEAQRAAMVMRNHRVLALLELAQGKCDTFAVRAQNLLSLGQRLVVLGSSELKLEFARAALEAARGLTNRWDFASGYLQSITHKTEDPVSEDVRRLYIAAERGLSLGAGPLSFPAFLALQGVCQTDRVAAASSARNLEMRADMKLRLEELDRVYYCYGIEAFE